jgi:hypothetical protein
VVEKKGGTAKAKLRPLCRTEFFIFAVKVDVDEYEEE